MDLFSSRFADSSPSPNPLLLSSFSSSTFDDLFVTEDDVIDAIGQLSLTGCIITEHLKLSHSVIALPLSQFFTSIVRHGYMPPCFCSKEQQRYICEF